MTTNQSEQPWTPSLCGECAKKKNMSIDERKELAAAVEHEVLYQCKTCEVYFGYFKGQYIKDSDVGKFPQPTESLTVAPETSGSRKPEKFKQISLF